MKNRSSHNYLGQVVTYVLYVIVQFCCFYFVTEVYNSFCIPFLENHILLIIIVDKSRPFSCSFVCRISSARVLLLHAWIPSLQLIVVSMPQLIYVYACVTFTENIKSRNYCIQSRLTHFYLIIGHCCGLL